MLSVPDGKDTTGLGETRLFLYTTDPLLQDGGNLGGSGLCFGSIASNLLCGGVEDDGGGSGLVGEKGISLGSTEELPSDQRCISNCLYKAPLRRHWIRKRSIGAVDDGKMGSNRNCSGFRWTYRRNSARGRDCSDPAARLADGSREHFDEPKKLFG